jgi:hypothetical protein
LAFLSELKKLEHQDNFFINGTSARREQRVRELDDQQQGDEDKRRGKRDRKNKHGKKEGGHGKKGDEVASVNQVQPLTATEAKCSDIARMAGKDKQLKTLCLNCLSPTCAAAGKMAATYANPLDKTDKTVNIHCSTLKACAACGDSRHTASWCNGHKVSDTWKKLISLLRAAGRERANARQNGSGPYGSPRSMAPAATSSEVVTATANGGTEQSANIRNWIEQATSTLASQLKGALESGLAAAAESPSKKTKNNHLMMADQEVVEVILAQVGSVSAGSQVLIAKTVSGGLAT